MTGGYSFRRFTVLQSGCDAYLRPMFRSFDFCIPTRGTAVPYTADWIHEIKYDGYRLRLERDGDSHPPDH
jgi:ATP-dependent DNA ligase